MFHEWVARALLGIPDAGHDVALHPDLGAWWTWRAFDLQELPAAVREVELPLVVPLGAYRLYARFDLLALSDQGEPSSSTGRRWPPCRVSNHGARCRLGCISTRSCAPAASSRVGHR